MINTHMTAKFIELHHMGRGGLVNIARIDAVTPYDMQTRIVVGGTEMFVDESYEQIRNALDSYLDTAVVKAK